MSETRDDAPGWGRLQADLNDIGKDLLLDWRPSTLPTGAANCLLAEVAGFTLVVDDSGRWEVSVVPFWAEGAVPWEGFDGLKRATERFAAWLKLGQTCTEVEAAGLHPCYSMPEPDGGAR